MLPSHGQIQEEGYRYVAINEEIIATGDTALNANRYGTMFVSKRYLAASIARAGATAYVRYPKFLESHRDIYLIRTR